MVDSLRLPIPVPGQTLSPGFQRLFTQGKPNNMSRNKLRFIRNTVQIIFSTLAKVVFAFLLIFLFFCPYNTEALCNFLTSVMNLTIHDHMNNVRAHLDMRHEVLWVTYNQI